MQTAKLVFSSLLLLAASAANQYAFAAPTIDCTIPNDVECTITDPAGISHVQVTIPTGFGPVVVVDKTLPTCRTSTTVSWDPIVPGFDIDVTNCEDKPGGKLTFGGFEHSPLSTHRATVNVFLDSRLGKQRVQAAPAARSVLELTHSPDGQHGGTLYCYDSPSCDIVAAICNDEENPGVGTCYEDHCECELP